MRNGELLVTSNFSFSNNVFHSYISLVRQNAVLSGNGLKPYLICFKQYFFPITGNIIYVLFNPCPDKPLFLCVCSKGLLKTLWEKKNCL